MTRGSVSEREYTGQTRWTDVRTKTTVHLSIRPVQNGSTAFKVVIPAGFHKCSSLSHACRSASTSYEPPNTRTRR